MFLTFWASSFLFWLYVVARVVINDANPNALFIDAIPFLSFWAVGAIAFASFMVFLFLYLLESEDLTGDFTTAGRKRTKWKIAIISAAIIVALIAAFALLTTKPSEVIMRGTVTAPADLNLNRITFTCTDCGTRVEVLISPIGKTSGTYAISLDNEHFYSVSISWKSPDLAEVEKEMGTIFLDTYDRSLVRDWTVQP